MIKTATAAEREVYRILKEIDEVVEVHSLFGEFDLIVKIQAENFNKLGQVVVDKIRTIEGVDDTKTLTGIEF